MFGERSAGDCPGRDQKPLALVNVATSPPRTKNQKSPHQVIIKKICRRLLPGAPPADRFCQRRGDAGDISETTGEFDGKP